MGEVYRARDVKLHREVALKVLPAAVALDLDRRARFEREAQLLAALNHPNIAAIYGFEDGLDAYPVGTGPALVLELVEGPTLADRLARGLIPLDEALPIARQIADALEGAHKHGIVHRDLKPSNIKVRPDGTVKVLDFGLAKVLEPAPTATDASQSPTITSPAVTRAGVILGTAAYMSPEQARGRSADAQSDIWAFGCVLYEMLCGRRPFRGETVSDTIAAILEREPDWKWLPPNVPANVRRALRRCLEKDPRRRFHHIADARLEIEDAAEELGVGPSLLSPAQRRRNRMLGIATAVLGLALAAALGIWYSRAPADAPELRLEITTASTADPSAFAISPDGRRVAFVADREGQQMLWVRALDVVNAQPLAGTEGARQPFWSPDNRWLGYFTTAGTLKRIEARGGPTQILATAVGATGGAWGRDGTILFSQTVTPSLIRVSSAGGPVETATTPTAGSTGHRQPQFLPGGRDFLFFSGGADDVRGIYLGSLGSSAATRLVASDSKGVYVSPGWLLFVRQGSLVAQRMDLARRTLSGEPVTVAGSVAFEPIFGAGGFSASDGGVIAYRAGNTSATRLSWFDRAGNALGAAGSPDQIGLSNLMLSPDGRRVAVERTLQNETDLWLLDATRQVRFTRGSGGTITRFPIWSPDSSRIAFNESGSGSVSISVKRLAGDGTHEVLLESPEVKVLSDWSPDGRFLLYYVPDPKTGTDLWVLPLDGERVPFTFLKTEANELSGQFSPDGRWVAYQSNESGRFEIYVRPFPGPSGQFPVSTAGGVYPRWSADGKEMYYIAPDAKLMAVPISVTTPTFEAGAPTTLFQTRRVGGGENVVGRGHQYDVAPDGRFLINVEAGSGTPPITLLLNWKPSDN
jgi:Tol biopolymer transport system component